ncbi:hypothetical protein LIER_26972 [Lithospermum erythrorhizon]|uniref:Uncharacterized protein n=1 Tax=Lithospermum erythrorhizon TaxID=34254 RepID=A0AAV3RDP8_LITER
MQKPESEDDVEGGRRKKKGLKEKIKDKFSSEKQTEKEHHQEREKKVEIYVHHSDLENVIVAQTLSTNEVNRDDNFELENSDSDSLGNDVYSSECESDLDEFEDPDYEVIEDDVLFSKFVDHDVRDGSEILNNDMSFFTSESLNAQLNDGQGENDVILSDGEGFDSDTHCSGNEDVGRGS